MKDAINTTAFLQKWKNYKKHPKSMLAFLLVILSAAITAGLILTIIGYILIKGIPHLSPSLFEWTYSSENVSMMPAIINTVTMTFLALIMAVPIGVFSAVYLVEYAKRGNKFINIIRVTTETLSGIPSIVYVCLDILCLPYILKWATRCSAAALRLQL